jgi:hypothetical protein
MIFRRLGGGDEGIYAFWNAWRVLKRIVDFGKFLKCVDDDCG